MVKNGEIQFDDVDEWRTDPNLEIGDGLDIDFAGGKFITVHRAGGRNVAYQRAIAAIPPRKLKRLSAVDDRELMIKVYVETVVIGWRGWKSGGKEMPFTPDNVSALFRGYADIFMEVMSKASGGENFLIEKDGDTAKNSEALSAGQ